MSYSVAFCRSWLCWHRRWHVGTRPWLRPTSDWRGTSRRCSSICKEQACYFTKFSNIYIGSLHKMDMKFKKWDYWPCSFVESDLSFDFLLERKIVFESCELRQFVQILIEWMKFIILSTLVKWTQKLQLFKSCFLVIIMKCIDVGTWIMVS